MKHSHEYKFVWLPTPLYKLRGPHWHPTGRYAWLERVRIVRTIYGDTVYVDEKEA